MKNVAKVFVDGGVVSVNPSPHGGTWAFIFLDSDDNEVMRGSGFISPADATMPTISNNFTELLAAIRAMDLLLPGWDGTIFTDSYCTLCRLVNEKPSMKGIPLGMVINLKSLRAILGPYKVVLLDGHPTKKQLATGIGKRGNPVSKWNVECDRMCGVEAKNYLSKLQANVPDSA